ncbi:putative staphylococcal protein [Staphylococcus agnetis]|uniref:hypothetical protein n=1 Tax=Staphylococcus agnetis TaxID=985762 RepID=UPI000DFDBADA|nr:hypothetical protein [Staphylococcus agnetis]SUK12688.1 putative staphylococcal protein [Staphylococcus agnetis]
MKQLKRYIERVLRTMYSHQLSACLVALNGKMHDIDATIRYLQHKKTQLQLLIDRQTIALENKYIDLLDEQHVQCPEKINGREITKMKRDLNEIEYEYAHLERLLNQLNNERNYTQQECDLLLTLRLAY